MNYNQTPLEIFGHTRHEGEIALELEVEGRGLPSISNDTWTSHHDGSLKLGGMEYVHNGPKNSSDLLETLKTWEETILKSGATVYESDRTSVHTHLNVQDKTLKQILQGAVAYYMLEPALMNHCGKGRQGNLFCLPMYDAPAVMNYIRGWRDGTISRMNSDSYRYASLNFGAIRKFGSIEARTMRGYYEPEFLTKWALNLKKIFDTAAEFKDPVEVFDLWYGRQAEDFMNRFLDEGMVGTLKSYDGWDTDLDRNHKYLSSFVYDFDWHKEFPKEEKTETFEDIISIRPWATIAHQAPVQTWVMHAIINNLDASRDLWNDQRDRLTLTVWDCIRGWWSEYEMTYPEDALDQIKARIDQNYETMTIERRDREERMSWYHVRGGLERESGLYLNLAEHFESVWNLGDQVPQEQPQPDNEDLW